MRDLVPADLIVIHGRIVTLDPLHAAAEAMAVRHGRIVRLGPTVDVLGFAGPGTRVIDAGGRMVLPGFQDTHIHLQDSGEDLRRSADLYDVETLEALKQCLSAFARSHDRPWVMGTGYNSGLFTAANLSRTVLDQAVPDRPCFLLSSDAHNACVNSAAARLLGLEPGIDDPANGHFVRDAAGVPTGLLYEDAIRWAEERMPEMTDDDFREGVLYAQALANRHGLTGVLDASVRERHARVYGALDRAGELTLRVAATARVEPNEPVADALARVEAMRASCAGDRFRVHSAKFFFDGVFENRTAALIAPYADATGGNAPVMFGADEIRALFEAFDAARFQLHVHAIGDAAVRAALDGIEAAQRRNGAWPALHQIAHVQLIDRADIPRFARLGVMANIQPLWAQAEPSITDLVQPIVGPGRAPLIYAFRDLLDAGATCALSSDWSVSTLNPFEIMEVAVTRQPPGAADHPVLMPEQRMTRLEALHGYTVNAARAAWNSHLCGSLAPGKSADFIVTDRDILTCDIHALGATEVLLTVLEGQEVYRAPGFEG